MKYKILAVFLTFCLFLCACNSTTKNNTTEPNSGNSTSGSETTPLPTDSTGDIQFTIGEEYWGMTLPYDEFDDEDQIVSSRPITATEPSNSTEPLPTETDPVSTTPDEGYSNTELPMDWWE